MLFCAIGTMVLTEHNIYLLAIETAFQWQKVLSETILNHCSQQQFQEDD